MEKEAEIKKYVSSAIIEADKDLKDKIMHQIEAENALIPKQTASNSGFDYAKLFKVLFIFFPILGGGLYFSSGISIFSSIAFYAPVLLISSSICLFWVISFIDDRWRKKNNVSTPS